MPGTSAVCKFCGQANLITTSGEPPEGKLLELAAIKACQCRGADKWRAMERFIESLDGIVGPGSKKNGFRGEVDKEAIKLIMEAASCIHEGNAAKVIIVLSPADRVTVEEKKDILTATRREVREM